jgi:hypothetical protein
MASIDGITVDRWRGTFQRPTRSVQLFDRAGVDGWGWVRNAARSQQSAIETVSLYGSEAAAVAGQTAFEALPGSVVECVDSTGTTHSNCLILGVQTERMAITGVAGAAIMLRCSWQIIAEDA